MSVSIGSGILENIRLVEAVDFKLDDFKIGNRFFGFCSTTDVRPSGCDCDKMVGLKETDRFELVILVVDFDDSTVVVLESAGEFSSMVNASLSIWLSEIVVGELMLKSERPEVCDDRP